VHASKGLEFAQVFIAGCEEGLMPHSGDAKVDGDEGEEADAPQQRIEEERLRLAAQAAREAAAARSSNLVKVHLQRRSE
jgi:superfamily I DNA/RNA helicase